MKKEKKGLHPAGARPKSPNPSTSLVQVLNEGLNPRIWVFLREHGRKAARNPVAKRRGEAMMAEVFSPGPPNFFLYRTVEKSKNHKYLSGFFWNLKWTVTQAVSNHKSVNFKETPDNPS